MKKPNLLISTILVFIILVSCNGQELIVYKTIDTVQLKMKIYPVKHMEDHLTPYPAMVFFFGGGWNGGDIDQFKMHAEHFSRKGIVCFLADYRVKNRQGTTPFESLKDAKSAIRFIKKNHKQFNIDSSKVIAAGGSAGGHLAAATALITDYNEVTDDTRLSTVPCALVLFNPVIDNGPGGYGFDRIQDDYKRFSPLHNIQSGTPPTIFFLGTEDPLIPVATAKYYKTVLEKVGSRCDLKLYENQGHGFFNFSRSKENYYSTVKETEKFLISLGYIKE